MIVIAIMIINSVNIDYKCKYSVYKATYIHPIIILWLQMLHTMLLIINVCNDTNDPHNHGLEATSSFQLKRQVC